MADVPKPRSRDSDATRARLLSAARTEFAERGLAGARIDRIAAAAATNKRMIYAYFTSKEGLFDAVVETNIRHLLDAVPFTADDLPGYAVAYFDQMVADPSALRLAMWRSFERTGGSTEEIASYAHKLDAIAAAQHDGIVVADLAPVDVLAMLLAITRSWLTAADALRTLAGSKPDSAVRIAAHRDGLRAVVQRALTTSP
jgi:AcrR family transcriptional regulator